MAAKTRKKSKVLPKLPPCGVWVRCKDRLPTRRDADSEGRVIWRWWDGDVQSLTLPYVASVSDADPQNVLFTHWMRIPPRTGAGLFKPLRRR